MKKGLSIVLTLALLIASLTISISGVAAEEQNYNINISNKEKYASSREVTDDTDKEDITMILVIGQSNSTTSVGYPCELRAVKNGNRDEVSEITATPEKNTVYMAKYGQTISELNDSNDVVTLIENGQIGGYSSALGKKWNELTGEKVVIVQAAVGASGMHEWVKDYTKYACVCGHNNQHYAKAVNQFNACYNSLKDNYNIKHSFYIWNQGEHDERYVDKNKDSIDINSKEKYFEAYKSMHEDLLADLPLDFGGINIARSNDHGNSMYLTVARSAQYKAVNELKGCYLASRVFENCTKDDMDQTAEGSYGIHALQKTYNTMGTDAAANLYNAVIGDNNGLKSIELIMNDGRNGVIKSRINGKGELLAGSGVLIKGEEISVAVVPYGNYTVNFSVDGDSAKVDEFGIPVDSAFGQNITLNILFSTDNDVILSSEQEIPTITTTTTNSMNTVTTKVQAEEKFAFEAEDCFGVYDATSKISYSTGSYSGWNADCTALDTAKQKFLIHSSNCAAVGQYITFNLTGLAQGSYELYFGHRQATGRSTYKVEAWDSSNTVQSAGYDIDFAAKKGTNYTSYFYSVKTSNEITVTEGNSLTLKMTITSIPKTGVSGFFMDKILLVKTADYEAPVEPSPVAMKSGASIRLNEKKGIRFYTTVDTAKLEELKAVDGNVVELGTLIAPVDLVTGELTHSIGKGKFVDVPYKADTYFAENTFVGSIIAIRSENIGRAFIGRGYIKVTNGGDVTYYYATQNDNERSLKSVAASYQGTDDYNLKSQEIKDLVDNWASAADWSAE